MTCNLHLAWTCASQPSVYTAEGAGSIVLIAHRKKNTSSWNTNGADFPSPPRVPAWYWAPPRRSTKDHSFVIFCWHRSALCALSPEGSWKTEVEPCHHWPWSVDFILVTGKRLVLIPDVHNCTCHLFPASVVAGRMHWKWPKGEISISSTTIRSTQCSVCAKLTSLHWWNDSFAQDIGRTIAKPDCFTFSYWHETNAWNTAKL